MALGAGRGQLETVPTTGGFLRRGVVVATTADFVRLTHSLWTLELPRPWVEGMPGMTALLERRASIHDIPPTGAELANVLALLEAQGCLSYPGDKDAYSLREIRELFGHLSASWYGRYYAHPLWDRLRAGSLSWNGFITWLLQTYHLSRSVGMSAARSASYLPQPNLRVLFARSAMEEYDHCEVHFFPRDPRLGLSEENVRRVVPLPSSVAFDQQMLRMAEVDGLGHVLAALFQETTARFHDEVRSFHQVVEDAYGLPGLFAEWEAHLGIDLNEGHAEEFGSALETDDVVAKRDVERSLRNAWFAYRFLLGALDDILEQDRPDGTSLLRLAVRGQALSSSGALRGASLRLGNVRGGAGSRSMPPPREDVSFVRRDVTASILRAMSLATGHDDVLLFGRLAERALATIAEGEAFLADLGQPRSPHAMAVGNFLRELATDARTFAFVLRHAIDLPLPATDEELDPRWHAVDEGGGELLDRFLGRLRPDGTTMDRLLTLVLQFDELYGRWLEHAGAERPVDFFRD